jgi:hypothetical protein
LLDACREFSEWATMPTCVTHGGDDDRTEHQARRLQLHIGQVVV